MTRSLGDALAAMMTDSAEDASAADEGLTGVRAEITPILRKIMAQFRDKAETEDGESTEEPAPALDADLKTDLGLDRLAVIEFAVRCEEATGVRIEDDDIAGFITLGDVVDYISGRS